MEAELGLVEGFPEVSVIIEPLGDGLEGEAGGIGAWGHDADGGEPIEEDALPRSDGDLPLAGGRSGLVGHESHLSASRGARLSLGAGTRALGARLPLGGARQARPRRAFAWRSRTLSLREARAGTRTNGWSGAVAHSPHGEARRRVRPRRESADAGCTLPYGRRGAGLPYGQPDAGARSLTGGAALGTTLEGGPAQVHAPLREARNMHSLGRPAENTCSLR